VGETMSQVSLESLIACETCGLVQQKAPLGFNQISQCARCGVKLESHKRNPIHRTLAFASAALILYIPANVYPIMSMNKLGIKNSTTIWNGVQELYEGHQYELALLVFTASIFIPLMKLIGLFYLCLTADKEGRRHERTRIYRIVESIGKWSMLDVFVLAILVALVKMGAIANIQAEVGSSFFGAVVVLTILASSSFDPQLIWNKKESNP